MTSTAIVAYLALFATVGFLFLFASLLLGSLLRAQAPTPLKLDTYECGEPAVGPGSVQFDLRFYVVALVFIIFEVEVALFFPPATVFGKATRLRDANVDKATVMKTYDELGVAWFARPRPRPNQLQEKFRGIEAQGRTLAISSMLDLGVFFVVLLVGFAFVWKRGDLDWVRAVRHPATPVETAALRARLRGDLRS